MSKAQETREKILREAAALFNQYGYSGSSMSDIMRVTGLQKGGIYNHFKSKDELAIQAFDFAAECMRKQYLTALKGKHNSVDRLKAIISLFSSRNYNDFNPGRSRDDEQTLRRCNSRQQSSCSFARISRQYNLEQDDFFNIEQTVRS
jgi:AcrR family transcriptional regulator